MIDAHQHFWKLSRNDYGWLTSETPELYRDYLPADLEIELLRNGVKGTILVQAASTLAETKFLLDLYEKHEWIYGVVGWLNFESSTFQKDLQSLLVNKGLVSLRPMLQDIADTEWILQENVMKNIQYMVDVNLPLDLLITERHFPVILKVLRAFPTLQVVINHLAKPVIKNQSIDSWQTWMKQFAQFPNVFCKVSGLMTEANVVWTLNDFKPYVNFVYDQFGSQRLLFGSDWPVCLTAGTYHQAIEIVKTNLFENSENECVFHNNAVAFYRLTERGRIGESFSSR